MTRAERSEYIVGVLALGLLIGALVLTAFANRQSVSVDDGMFRVTADFGQADGIYVGSPVRIGGVDVGTVSEMALGEQSLATLTLLFYEYVPLPDDTAAVIETDGIFGSKYLELYPGGEDLLLEAGDRISYTQDSVILEELIALIVERARAASNVESNDD